MMKEGKSNETQVKKNHGGAHSQNKLEKNKWESEKQDKTHMEMVKK